MKLSKEEEVVLYFYLVHSISPEKFCKFFGVSEKAGFTEKAFRIIEGIINKIARERKLPVIEIILEKCENPENGEKLKYIG